MFKQLTEFKGYSITVNIGHIVSIVDLEEGCMMTLITGKEIHMQYGAEEILINIEDESKGILWTTNQ
jgi:hypothetical protein